jgi:hypothetical protein
LNRTRSGITAAQAAMLDAHFLVEHGARSAHGLFFNFNGTAGAWRRACIESAGGWQHDTLTEDLDLSYRAQSCGWRFVFDPAIGAPGELPRNFGALRSQQRRWIRGSIQTARKLLPGILSSSLPWRVKLEAFAHLTGNIAYPLVLLLAALNLPMMLLPWAKTRSFPGVEGCLALCGMTTAVWFLDAGLRGRGDGFTRRGRDVIAALTLAAGLSVHNTRAVLEGLGSRLGDWERTPKTGEGAARSGGFVYTPSGERGGGLELILALYFVISAILAWKRGHPLAVPFLLLLTVGLAWVGLGSVIVPGSGHRALGAAPDERSPTSVRA